MEIEKEGKESKENCYVMYEFLQRNIVISSF